ncbi:MAG: amidohydrolase, partial [Chitinophagaceae bacterium]
MKKYLSIILSLACSAGALAQETVYPTPGFSGTVLIKNATVHVGTGTVLSNASVLISNDKIEKVGTDVSAPANATVVDATGKHVYPGLILSNSNLGLKEIGAQVRGSNDFNEIGELNPNIQSIVAYNTDSKIINTLRSNGILLAN